MQERQRQRERQERPGEVEHLRLEVRRRRPDRRRHHEHKGRYNARTNTFTPVEGVEIPDGYVDQIDTIVRQKIRYSKEVLDLDYFATIFGKK